MKRPVLTMMAFGLLLAIGTISCEKGPMQRTGEKLDRATDQDKLFSKGPIEKVGKSIDEALKR